MITKPANPKLAIPCKQCGQPVPIKNGTALHYAKSKGIRCKSCLALPQWTEATYQEYLKSEHWQNFRYEVFKYYGRKCYMCGTEEGQIDIHHNDYSRLGYEHISDVIPLCHFHHEQYEEANK